MTDKTVTKTVREKEYYFDSNSIYIEFCSRVWVRNYDELENFTSVDIESKEVLRRFNLNEADKLKETLDKQIKYVRDSIDRRLESDKYKLERASPESDIKLYP